MSSGHDARRRGRPSRWSALALICLNAGSFDEVQAWARLYTNEPGTTDQLADMLVRHAKLAGDILDEQVVLERHGVTIAEGKR